MGNKSHRTDALETRLWDAVETRRVGMLGLTKSGLHYQPMTAFVDRRRNRIWFFASRDTDLVRSVGDGGSAMFVFQDTGLQASIGGSLSVAVDRRRMDRYWSSAVSAWFPLGKDDPQLTMLRMDCTDAEVSISEIGLTKFVWEVALPATRRRAPDRAGRTAETLH